MENLLAIKKNNYYFRDLLFICQRCLRRLLAPVPTTKIHSVPVQNVIARDSNHTKRDYASILCLSCNSASTWLSYPLKNSIRKPVSPASPNVHSVTITYFNNEPLIWQALPTFDCCSGNCQSWAILTDCVSSLLLDWMTFIHCPIHSPFHSCSVNWIESWTGSKSSSDAKVIVSTSPCCFTALKEPVPSLFHIPVCCERVKRGYKDCFETLEFLLLVRTCKWLGCRHSQIGVGNV